MAALTSAHLLSGVGRHSVASLAACPFGLVKICMAPRHWAVSSCELCAATAVSKEAYPHSDCGGLHGQHCFAVCSWFLPCAAALGHGEGDIGPINIHSSEGREEGSAPPAQQVTIVG